VKHHLGIRRRALLAIASAVILNAFAAGSVTAQQPDELPVKVRFSIDRNGSFAGDVLHTLGQREVAAIIAAGCAAYGVDCSQEAAAGVALARQIDANMSGGGNEHHGIYRAPVGYAICRAKLDYAHAGISGGASMSAQLMRTAQDNGLGWYANVPRGDGRGEGFDADIYIEFILASPGNLERHGCWEPHLLWDCHGHDGCKTFDPAARY
jgi:hypothetical protein